MDSSTSLEINTVTNSKVEQTKELPCQPKMSLFGTMNRASFNQRRLPPTLQLLKFKNSEEEIDKKDVSQTSNNSRQDDKSFQKVPVASLDDCSLESDSSDSDSDSSMYSEDEEIATGCKMDSEKMNGPRQPSIYLNIPKHNGRKIIFNKEINCFQVLAQNDKNESNLSSKSQSTQSFFNVGSLIKKEEKSLDSGEHLKQMRHQQMVNLTKNFQWTMPTIVQCQDNSEQDSIKSDGLNMGSTDGSFYKGSKSPAYSNQTQGTPKNRIQIFETSPIKVKKMNSSRVTNQHVSIDKKPVSLKLKNSSNHLKSLKETDDILLKAQVKVGKSSFVFAIAEQNKPESDNESIDGDLQ